MCVTPDNVDQVEDVFLLSKQLGADAFSAAIITSFGRAANIGMCAEKDHYLQNKVACALAPYANDPLFDSNRLSLEFMKENKEINCGAGWRTFSVNGATGEVRSCLFLTESKKFGSVDKENYGTIFKNREIHMFRTAPSPSPLLETCKSCKYNTLCKGCFAKAFRISDTEYPECPWRRRYFLWMQPSDTKSEALAEVNESN